MEKALKPYASLKYPNFRFFVFSHFFFTVGLLCQEVVLSFYLYDLTHNELSLGLVGLAEAVPYILLALFGGYLADTLDKKKLYLGSFGIVLGVSIFLAIYFNDHVPNVSQDPIIIYVSIFILGVARGFYSPAWSSLKPYLVPAAFYSNAASWSAQFWMIGRIIGPVLGGFAFAYIGLNGGLLLSVFLFFLTLITAACIDSFKIEKVDKQSIFKSIAEGVKFVRSTPIIFYSISLDMLSVLFGGVIAILPAFAKDVLHIGADGLGFLRAAPAAGAVLTMFITAYYPPTKKAWQNMLIAVAGFGVATMVFAFSESFMISIVALFFTGAFDAISVVIRSTIMQIVPPAEMRGRISSVNSIFVSTSNELGAFESGLAASLMGLQPSVVAGASLTLLISAYTFMKTKSLLKLDLLKEKEMS